MVLRRGLESDAITYNADICACFGAKLPDSATELFLGLEPNVITSCAAICAFDKASSLTWLWCTFLAWSQS